jgi:hypothetical protein
MNSRIVLLHYRPIEDYPPAMNTIRFLSTVAGLKLTVITSAHSGPREKFECEGVRILHMPSVSPQLSLALRILKYWNYNIQALFILLKVRPTAILCFESASSWPAYAFIHRLGINSRLHIHFHEYIKREEYHTQMWLDRYNQNLESKYLYQRSVWISHTNKDRLSFFQNEYPHLDKDKLHVLPNYPPKAWQKKILFRNKAENDTRVKLVYVGSLSFETTYIREIVEWVKCHRNFILTICSYNLKDDVKNYLIHSKQSCDAIEFIEKGLEYDDLPNYLSGFDIGLILYKSFMLNFEYNAPNKLFEYLTCGLMVWYPEELKGCETVANAIGSKKIKAQDFNSLNGFGYSDIKMSDLKNSPSTEFVAEEALLPLKKSLLDLE